MSFFFWKDMFCYVAHSLVVSVSKKIHLKMSVISSSSSRCVGGCWSCIICSVHLYDTHRLLYWIMADPGLQRTRADYSVYGSDPAGSLRGEALQSKLNHLCMTIRPDKIEQFINTKYRLL